MTQRFATSANRFLRATLYIAVLASLLYYALRHAPLADILQAALRLRAWQLLLLLCIDFFIYVLITARWWIIIRAQIKNIPLLPLVAVRVAVFGLSYFTLGPQLGGEALQILYLRRKHGASITRATASVFMDKLLEFLGNFILLAAGITGLIHSGIISTSRAASAASLIALALIALWPPIHLALLYREIHPLAALVRRLPLKRFGRFLAASEHLAGDFCRRHFKDLLSAIAVSLLAAFALVLEYFLMTRFLGLELSFWETIAAWTSGWLAFLVPLPGGLGALEASQVLTLGLFGVPAAAALALTLLIRGRDLLVGGIGLLIAGRHLHGNVG